MSDVQIWADEFERLEPEYTQDVLSTFGKLLGPPDIEFDPVFEQWRLDEESILANSKIRFNDEDEDDGKASS